MRRVAAACVTGSAAWTVDGVAAKAPAPVMKLPDGGFPVACHRELLLYCQS